MSTKNGETSGKNGLFRTIFFFALVGVCIAASGSVFSLLAMAEGQPPMTETATQVPDVEHPMTKPQMYSTVMQCPNCGMMINMWARTRHTFHHPEGDFTTCSIRCMADKAVSSGAEPSGAEVALYLEPEKMVPVEQAAYVIGSTAPGTMTMKSKIAFADKAAAEQFASMYGGQVMDFQGAFAAAKAELPTSRMAIDKKRKKTGKIKEPTETDTCTVCGMKPVKFPRHHAQILAKNGDTLHFCSTQCMVNFNGGPEKYLKEPFETSMAWVTLYGDGMYESAFGSYYVVGSQVDGPMGREAIPFKLKKDADEFVKTNGGRIVSFPQLTPALVMEAN